MSFKPLTREQLENLKKSNERQDSVKKVEVVPIVQSLAVNAVAAPVADPVVDDKVLLSTGDEHNSEEVTNDVAVSTEEIKPTSSLAYKAYKKKK